jgi:protocatechuate 3,4-dioxygenase beta subunit
MRSLSGCCQFRVLVSLLLLASAAQMNVTHVCGQEAAEQGAMNSLHLVLRQASGEGIAGCPVQLSGRIGKLRLNKRAETSENGSVDLEYADGTINYLRLSIKQPGFVPVYYSWDSDNTEIKLPKELTIELQRGREIRGRVVDEMHQPVKNASVRISAPVTWPKRDSYVFGLATLQTDAAGNWSFADAPKDIGRVSIRVSHPDYKDGQSKAKEDTTTITLEKGISFPGRVLDSKGNPIAGAVVRLGPDRFGIDIPEARTDEDGQFDLKNCELGKTVLTVQAHGFSPQILEVDVQDKNETGVALRLEPPHTLRIRVVDENGEPLPDVQFAVDGWRGYRSLEYRGRTNASGEAIWDSAPPDAMICDFFKSGRMANRDVPCVPGEEFNIVRLYPELEISGRVIDRQGEKPVASFRMIRGQNQSNLRETYWRTDETHAFENGKFKFTFNEPMKSWQLKVIAEGYKPRVSREFKSTEGRVRYSFLLERASTLSGVVVDASGDPVAGAQVVIARSGNNVVMQNGYLDLRESASKPVHSATDGGFTVTLPEEGFFLLIAVHENGFAELSKADISQEQVVKLQPWGKIAGVSMLGDTVDAGRDISYFAQRPRDGRSFGMVEYDYETSTDEGGKFELDRVIPGAGTVSRVLVVDYGSGSLHSPGWQVPVDVAPGSQNSVKIGGEGFSVSGKLTTDRKPPQDTGWKFEPSVSLEAFDKKTGERIEPFTRYPGKVEEDGSFTVHSMYLRATIEFVPKSIPSVLKNALREHLEDYSRTCRSVLMRRTLESWSSRWMTLSNQVKPCPCLRPKHYMANCWIVETSAKSSFL